MGRLRLVGESPQPSPGPPPTRRREMLWRREGRGDHCGRGHTVRRQETFPESPGGHRVCSSARFRFIPNQPRLLPESASASTQALFNGRHSSPCPNWPIRSLTRSILNASAIFALACSTRYRHDGFQQPTKRPATIRTMRVDTATFSFNAAHGCNNNPPASSSSISNPIPQRGGFANAGQFDIGKQRAVATKPAAGA